MMIIVNKEDLPVEESILVYLCCSFVHATVQVKQKQKPMPSGLKRRGAKSWASDCSAVGEQDCSEVYLFNPS